MKSGFTRTIDCNKHHSKVKIQRENQYLDYLIDPSFQGVNRIFVLSFEDNAARTGQRKYAENAFYQLVKIDLRKHDNNIKSITIG